MKYNVIIFHLALVLFACIASAQPMPPMGGPGHERLERFRKMRLVEVLKLNEEESVRFFAKQSAHEDKVHELMKSRNDALDAIDSKVKDKADSKEIQKLSAQVLNIDEQVFSERKRYQDELKNFLTPEQFGKFLVFERNFEHRMREAIEDMMQERRHHNRDD